LKKDERIAGLEGARRALLQAEEEYEIISNKLCPDGKIGRWNEDPKDYCYHGWLIDRQNRGLANTVINM